MSPCDRVLAALVERDDPSRPLPPDLGVHVSRCERCARRAAHAAALSLAARRAGAALEARVTLSPNAWARIRAGVEAAPRPWSAGSPRSWWLAALAAAALVAFLVTRVEAPPPGGALAAWTLATAPQAPPASPPEAEPPPLRAPDGPAPTPSPAPSVGDELGGDRLERWTAFGRHALTLDPGARATVVAWDEDGIVLDLARGRLHADVHRDRPGEVFEVRVDAARVRVLGTVFDVERLADGGARVTVEHGLVLVVDGEGDAHRVPAGEALTLATRPSPPKAARRPKPRPAPRAAPAEAPVAPSAPDAAVAHVVEIEVPAQAMPAPSEPMPSLRPQLEPIVVRIRGGDCAGALTRLKEVARAVGGRRTPPDILYLMGWCYRHQGQRDLADAFFDRYQRLAPSGPWPLPTSPDDVLPPPRADHLAP